MCVCARMCVCEYKRDKKISNVCETVCVLCFSLCMDASVGSLPELFL